MITTVLSWIWIGSGLLLILFVLLHSPKGDGMGGLAASGSSTFTSSSSAEATEPFHVDHACGLSHLGDHSQRWLASIINPRRRS